MSIGLLLALSGLLGLFTGAIVFLFRQLVLTKDQRISELVTERDYYRSAALLERAMPLELHPAALPPGTAIATQPPAIRVNEAPEIPGQVTERERGQARIGIISLAIQAGISVVVVIGSFWLIVQPTEPTANQVAYQLLSFVV